MKSDETVVTGVSGGADSLYLLFHLQQAGQPVIAAILDHQLRPESSREVAFVQEICVTYGVPCVAGKADVAALAQTRRCSIEEAARIARYEFLFGVARRHHAAAVATAHHADDQVETVLMHFLRGSGLEGLTGMRPRTILPQWDPEEKIPLIRPILNVSRTEIESWCRETRLTPVEDQSNQDTQFFRNRLRHKLIPLLEAEYSPQIRRHIQTLAQTAHEDMQIIHEVIDAAWQQCHIPDDRIPDAILLNRSEFSRLAPGVRARILRRCLFQLCPEARDVGFDSVQRMHDFIASCDNENSVRQWEKNLSVAVEADMILIYPGGESPNPLQYPQLTTGSVSLSIPGEFSFSGWQLTCRILQLSSEKIPALTTEMAANRSLVYLDWEKIELPLILRTANAGEMFRPLGSGGRQKLSDFWINTKIPRAYRAGHPLIADRNEPIWIPGLRPADFCRLTSETTKALRLELKKRR